MSRCVARHSLKLTRKVNESSHVPVGMIQRVKLLRFLQCFIQCRPWVYLLGSLVTQLIGHSENSSHIADCRSCFQCIKGDYLGHPVRTVALYNIVLYSLTPLNTEIYIEVRHTYSLGIKKSLKEQVELYGIDSCYADTISTKASCSRTSAGTYGDIMLPCISNEVPDYEIVVGVAHFRNNVKLILHALPDVFGRLSAVSLYHALSAKLTEVDGIIFNALNSELRELYVAELEFHITAPGYFSGVADSFLMPLEKQSHLLSGLNIELICLEAYGIGFIKSFSCLYAEKHVLHLGVALIYIVTVIGSCKLNACFRR